MRTSALAIAACCVVANAFPSIARQVAEQNAKRQSIPAATPFPSIGGIPRPKGSVPFIEEQQFVSTSGEHRFIAPTATDQRGPCPGLNAAANHGYLPRDGIATFESINTGLFEAFGLGRDSTQFLQQTTAFFDGDILASKWSIGTFSTKTYFGGGVLSSLGQQSGICKYGHLKSEGDASITRGDFRTTDGDNDNCLSYPKFFQELLDLACERTRGTPDECNIDMATLAEHQHNRKLHSIKTNPNYFSPPFAGVAFTPAAHHFVYALMANHSAERPEGILTPADLMTFFSYTRSPSGALIYTPGHEKIPEDWYKRAVTDPWTLGDIVAAVAQQCSAFPSTCAVGGNTGTVNSFAGIDPGDVSGGLFNAQAYRDPYKLGCFISFTIQSEVADFANRLAQGPEVQLILNALTATLAPELARGFGECGFGGAPPFDPLPVVGGLTLGSAQPPRSKAKPMNEFKLKFPGVAMKSNKGPRDPAGNI